MNKELFVATILLALISSFNCQLIVTGDFNYCASTGVVVDIESSCLDQQDCGSTEKELRQLLKYEDEFHRIDSTNKNFIYSRNDELYHAQCVAVKQINVAQRVQQCSRDIHASFMVNGVLIKGFLAKSDILRETSLFVDCTNETEFFAVRKQNLSIVRFQNLVTLLNQSATLHLPLRYSKESGKKTVDNIINQEASIVDQFLEFKPKNLFEVFLVSIVGLYALIKVSFHSYRFYNRFQQRRNQEDQQSSFSVQSIQAEQVESSETIRKMDELLIKLDQLQKQQRAQCDEMKCQIQVQNECQSKLKSRLDKLQAEKLSADITKCQSMVAIEDNEEKPKRFTRSSKQHS